MEVKYWGLLIVWAIVIAVMIYFFVFRRKQVVVATDDKKILVANAGRLTQTPEFIVAYKRYLRTFTRIIIAAAVMLTSLLFISVRPAHMDVANQPYNKRDIMLCLDVSPSMYTVDAQVLGVFAKITENFQGENVGLITFNSSPAIVFPLTSDYAYALEQIKIGAKLFKQTNVDGSLESKAVGSLEFDLMTAGTNSDYDKGSSQVGNGLTSCVAHMNRREARSQYVILATDNETSQEGGISTEDGMKSAIERKVRVYTLSPPVNEDTGFGSEGAQAVRAELKSLAQKTGGDGYVVANKSVDGIVKQIRADEAKLYESPGRPESTDWPILFIVIFLVSGGYLVWLLWRRNP